MDPGIRGSAACQHVRIIKVDADERPIRCMRTIDLLATVRHPLAASADRRRAPCTARVLEGTPAEQSSPVLERLSTEINRNYQGQSEYEGTPLSPSAGEAGRYWLAALVEPTLRCLNLRRWPASSHGTQPAVTKETPGSAHR